MTAFSDQTPARAPIGPLSGRLLFSALMLLVVLAPLPLGSNRPLWWSLAGLGAGALLVLWAAAALFDTRLVGMSWRRHGLATLIFLGLCLWLALQAGLWGNAEGHPFWHEAAGALGLAMQGGKEGITPSISLDPEASRTALMRILLYGAVFWLAMQLGRDGTCARRGFWMIAIAGTLYALYGIAVQFSGSDTILWLKRWAYNDVLTSTFVNRNTYATYAGLTLLVVLALLGRELTHMMENLRGGWPGFAGVAESISRHGYLLLFMAMIIFAALLLTESRGGFLAAGIGMVVLFAFFGWRARLSPRGWIAAGALMAAGIYLAVAVSGENLVLRMVAPAAETVTSTDDRGAIHGVTSRARRDIPAGGTGLGTFPGLFHLYRGTDFPTHTPPFQRVHNTYMEFALEAGTAALVAALIIFFYLTASCVRGALIRERRLAYPIAGASASCLVGVHALADFSIQVPAVAITYAAILGIGFAQSWHSGNRYQRPSPPSL